MSHLHKEQGDIGFFPEYVPVQLRRGAVRDITAG